MRRKNNRSLILVSSLLALLTVVCSTESPPPTEVPTVVPLDEEISPPAKTEAPLEVDAESTEEPTLTEPAPEEEPSGRLEIKELDPCALVTEAQVEEVLGLAPGSPIEAENEVLTSCTYILVPGETFVTTTVYAERGAKSFLLSDIAALQNNCSGLWLNTWAGEASLPPEIEALRTEPVLDIFVRDLELQSECGFPVVQLNELGENAYQFLPFGTVVGVASDKALATFLIQDTSLSSEEQLGAVIKLARFALQD